jgi:glycosyltransferase involved in cell wall biosynthesis
VFTRIAGGVFYLRGFVKISVISPVKNEVDFIGYSIMAVMPFIHEIVYTCAPSTDGTDDLLKYIQKLYAGDKLKIFYGETGRDFDFDPMDMAAYNAAYNFAIEQATGDAVWFLHPDMVVTNPEAIAIVPESPLAWFTHVNSYARDLKTEIVVGRAKRWKNIHAKQFGLHYYGGYGSVNEDFYHRDITGKAYRHHGQDFTEYPFEVGDSGITVNHYCELKNFDRRLEKMKRCLRTQQPNLSESDIDKLARQHPRVTLKDEGELFGRFEFGPSKQPVPPVFTRYGDEFAPFKKGTVNA